MYDLAALRHRMAYLEREHALIAARHIFGLKGGRAVTTPQEKTKQRGYYDLNVGGFIIACLIVGAFFGIVIAYLVPWLWSFIKPLIHTITA